MRLWRRSRKEPDVPSCSFCGKTRHQVERIIAGPGVSICNECVGICNQVLADEDVRPGP